MLTSCAVLLQIEGNLKFHFSLLMKLKKIRCKMETVGIFLKMLGLENLVSMMNSSTGIQDHQDILKMTISSS